MRGWIYDVAFSPLTTRWYAEVLRRLPMGSHLLDVGIGTGGALSKNARLVRERDLRVTGVDIDPDYVRRSQRNLEKAGLDDLVDVMAESVYDHKGGPYDAVYFSASFMLLPQPARALQHVASLLSSEGRVFFTQTFQEKRSALVERAKPLLGRVTTIEFGQVTYEDDFLSTIDRGGLELFELTTLKSSRARTYRLAVGVPRGMEPIRE